MNDLDLEDIESHLYSQIYHSNERTEEDFNTLALNKSEGPTRNMRNPNRYFQKNKKNVDINQTKGVVNYLRKLSSTVEDNHVHTEYLYTKDSGRPFKPLAVPFSQAFSSTGRMRSRERRKQRRAALKRSKAKQNTVYQNPKTLQQNDVITLSDSDGESCVVIPNQWPTLSLTDSEDEAHVKLNKEDKPTTAANNDVKTPIQTSFEGVDDVIFVEPTNAPVEIINIDEEISPRKSPDEVSAHADVETASVASSSNSFINAYSLTKSPSAKNTHKERKELLSTPDSASNDFISNTSIEVGKSDFNFSLHGKDFNNDEFVKPTNPSEVCETESSSSTADPNNINTMKTIVFNEIEFPKEGIFSEANLESFGNFITPLRKGSAKKATQNSTPLENILPAQSQNVYSSDSSSESDFEDADVDNKKESTKKSKNLPELSPMLSLQAVKEHKKVSTISSKYDLLNANMPEVTKSVKQKKRKSSDVPVDNSEGVSSKKKNKNKRKKTETKNKSSVSLTEAEETLEVVNPSFTEVTADNGLLDTSVQDNNHDVGNEGETRQKRKKSRELLEEVANNTDTGHSKKKTKNKKKKSFTESESTDENVNDNEVSLQQQKDSVDKTQEKEIENVHSTQAMIKSEPKETHFVKEMSSVNSHIKFENDDRKLDKEKSLGSANNFQIFAIKIEQGSAVDGKLDNKESEKVANVSNKDEVIGIQFETCEDFVVLDQTGNDEDINRVLSSDSESNLSALNGHEDIQLVNCEESHSQETSAITVNNPGKSNVLDLTRCTVAEVQHNMSSDPKMWTILDSDRMPPDKNSLLNRRCNRCREKGHMAVRCPNKVVAKCRLCGGRGHYEPRCPNRICTQCGSRRPYSTTTCIACVKFRHHKCGLCLMVGHPASACPDLWRRYHMTTSEGPLRYSNGPLLKPKHSLWCSGCARSGHLEYSCRYYKSMYPPSDPRIRSYTDVYQSNAPVEFQQMGQSLCFNIDNNYNANYNIPQQPNEQRYPIYHDQSNYGMNSYVENTTYVNNQGNFCESTTSVQNTEFYHDKDNYQSQFFFEDNLPNFISFDTAFPSNFNNMERVVGNIPSQGRYFGGNIQNNSVENEKSYTNNTEYWMKEHSEIFSSGSAENVFQLIKKDLQDLWKTSRQLNRYVNYVRKQQVNPTKKEVKEYNKILNMVLFGIYKFNEGGKHLNYLKNFKLQPARMRNKLSQQRRAELQKSYSYIFGKEKHRGIDYNELLRRIF